MYDMRDWDHCQRSSSGPNFHLTASDCHWLPLHSCRLNSALNEYFGYPSKRLITRETLLATDKDFFSLFQRPTSICWHLIADNDGHTGRDRPWITRLILGSDGMWLIDILFISQTELKSDAIVGCDRHWMALWGFKSYLISDYNNINYNWLELFRILWLVSAFGRNEEKDYNSYYKYWDNRITGFKAGLSAMHDIDCNPILDSFN